MKMCHYEDDNVLLSLGGSPQEPNISPLHRAFLEPLVITTRELLFWDRNFRSQNSDFRSPITIGDRIETENFRSQKPWSQTQNGDQNFFIWSLIATGYLGRWIWSPLETKNSVSSWDQHFGLHLRPNWVGLKLRPNWVVSIWDQISWSQFETKHCLVSTCDQTFWSPFETKIFFLSPFATGVSVSNWDHNSLSVSNWDRKWNSVSNFSIVGLRPTLIWSLILSSLRPNFVLRSLILNAIILRPYLRSVSKSGKILP